MCTNVDNILIRFFELIKPKASAPTKSNSSATSSHVSQKETNVNKDRIFARPSVPPPAIPPKDQERSELIKKEYERLGNEYKKPYIFESYQTKDAYICIKTPTSSWKDIMDFWKMIWNKRVLTIVLADRYIPHHRTYLPSEVGQILDLQNGFSIHNVSVEEHTNFRIAYLHVMNQYEVINVRNFRI
jgi:protein tyrosine phosphatase